MYLYQTDKEMNRLPAQREVDANHSQGVRGEERQKLAAHRSEKQVEINSASFDVST
jgi:hypothetical protein